MNKELIKQFEEMLTHYKELLEKDPDSTFYRGLVKNTEEYINELKENDESLRPFTDYQKLKNWDLYDNKTFKLSDAEIVVGDHYILDNRIYILVGFGGYNNGKVGDSMPKNNILNPKRSRCSHVRHHCTKIIFDK